jgi:outer membrane protein TolC
MTRRRRTAARTLLLLAAAAAVLPGRAAAQAVTLRDALRQADADAYGNRIAAGQTAAQAGTSAGAWRGLLPTLRVEGGYVRTTDPLGAFGFLLQQRAVTAAAFDPARLNDPEAIGNVAAATIVEQPLVNVDAWYGRRAAVRAVNAARASEDWTRSGTQVDVVRGYYGAVLAREMVDALDSAVASAQAHQRQAESMYRNELVTRSDALLAAVRAGEVEARHVAAAGDAELAGARLALAMGVHAESVTVAASRLPGADAIRRFVGADTGDGGPRDDVRAARFAADAASADARRATAAMLPRVNAFGRLDWNSADSPFAGDNAWTAGVMVRWTPFSGGAELADRRAAAGRRASAEAGAQAAEARARLEQAEAETALRVALARMAIAERAVDQSIEAHRIVSRKYEGGLAGVTDLFDAAATETATRLAFAESRYQVIVAAAQRRRVNGRDVAEIATLEEME